MNKNIIVRAGVIVLAACLFFVFTASRNEKGDNNNRLRKTFNTNNLSVGDAYRLFVNKIDLPMNSKGIIADVNIDGQALGRIDGKGVIFSSGFFLSGYNPLGIKWTNGNASASRVEDYEPGNVPIDISVESPVSDGTYAGMYVVKSKDEPFGDSWQAWAEAVAGGAYFYDGDGDGVYTPEDKNSNGAWDPDEDMPDLLGDETVWCVFNDNVDASGRAYANVEPQGIEVRQTAWAYATAGDLGNIIFLRYSILNTGLYYDVLDSVFIGIWADPDVGEATDDLVGSDTTLNAGYVYNDGADDQFGIDPPCFLIDFFQGPWDATGNPDDFALNTKGPLLGVDTIWGAQNRPLTSFIHYIQSDPTQGDPDNEDQARNYLIGKNQNGGVIDACNWVFGAVMNEDCANIDTRYMYSGDPVALKGWINTTPTDQRQMSNTGPFTLRAGEPVDIVVAYVIGRSTSAIASVKEAKKVDRAAQFVFQNNFNYPAPPPLAVPIVKTEDNAIELIWETADQLAYREVGVGYDMQFEGYSVHMYNRNSTAEQEAGMQNRVLIANYDVANDITSILFEDAVSSQRTITYPGGTQLDSAVYADPETGRIRLRITQDPFTGGPLIKGKNYFISITGFALNHEEIVKFDALGTYLIPATAAVGSIANLPLIINDDKGNIGIVPGKDENTPFYTGIPAEHTSGESSAEVLYNVIDKDKTTTHAYEVGFFKDSLLTEYSLYYYIDDADAGIRIADSLKNYDANDVNFLHDGVTVTVPWVDPGIESYNFTGDPWFVAQDDSLTGSFYVGSDAPIPDRVYAISGKSSPAISVDRMKTVELRFGQESRSFRYVKDPLRFVWGGGNARDHSLVDSTFSVVPFQAWVNDGVNEYQLATGFCETALGEDTLGMPDAVWYPGANVNATKEYIIIFDAPYDSTPPDVDGGTHALVAYTGYNGTWADLGNGYRIKTTSEIVTDSLKDVAKSPWFDAMYVVGFNTNQPRDNFNPTGTYQIIPGQFLTERDIFSYKIQVDKTSESDRASWDKVNVFPNPLFGTHSGISYTGGRFDDPYVTFNNLPEDVTIRVYSLSGVLLRTLQKNDLNSALVWDLQNEDGLRVASGMYIALVENPKYGSKVLKLAVIMPQKQLLRY